MSKVLCWLGFHKWYFFHDFSDGTLTIGENSPWICERCGKKRDGTPDQDNYVIYPDPLPPESSQLTEEKDK